MTALFQTKVNGVLRDVIDAGYIPVGNDQIAGLVVSRLPEETLEIGQRVSCLDGEDEGYEVIHFTDQEIVLKILVN